MTILDELKWLTMTAAVNEIRSPSTFLQDLCFSNHVTLSTETIEVDTLIRGRSVAPMVRKNGEAIMVGGYSSKKALVEAPNIRIKRPFTPSELLFGRKPGTGVFITQPEQMSAVQLHINRDLQGMADLITNSQEWMCAQALTGTITYSVEDDEVFTITYPKPAANIVDVSGAASWGSGAGNIAEDCITAKRVVSDYGIGLTTALCSSSAAAAFRGNAALKALLLPTGNIAAGKLELINAYAANGAFFMGSVMGLDFYEYSRTLDVNGTTTPLIRDKWVEFISTNPAVENVLYYGAIPDMKAMDGGQVVAERFAKSWMQDDPSALMALVHSRPLPVTRRPGTGYSLKVLP